MKTCCSCKQEKEDDAFNWKNKSKGIRQNYCRECKKTIQKKYYHASRDAYLGKIKEWRKARVDVNRVKVREYLEAHPCVDCGNSDIRVLEFDHVRGKKVNEVTVMLHDGMSWDKIETEIAKCEIRCANCHRIKTWGGTRWKTAEELAAA